MKNSIILLALFVPLAHADVYKTVTGNGEIIFSDVPSQGAERVKLPELTIFKPPPVTTATTGSGTTAAPTPGVSYKSFTVSSPEDQASFWDNEGNVKMTVSPKPPLQIDSGHKVQFYLDGKPYGSAELSLANTFLGVERGTHTLSASVLDADGTALISTTPVTIHLHKASILHPNNPGYTP
jgi:hypothetical protein